MINTQAQTEFDTALSAISRDDRDTAHTHLVNCINHLESKGGQISLSKGSERLAFRLLSMNIVATGNAPKILVALSL